MKNLWKTTKMSLCLCFTAILLADVLYFHRYICSSMFKYNNIFSNLWRINQAPAENDLRCWRLSP